MSIRFGNRLPERFLGGERPGERPATRVALVGAGAWGAEHARALSANPFAELVAVCGRDAARTGRRAAELGAEGFTDIGALLDKVRPDLVALCLPSLGHFEPTLQVLEAGVAAFVEKPLVFELEQGRRLVETAERSGLFFAINFNHRYAEPLLRARALLDAGRLGALRFASWRFGGDHDRLEHPHANLIETQCHGIDLLQLLAGRVESVSAQMSGASGKGGFATLALALAFESGAVGSLLGSYDADYAHPGAQRLELSGAGGSLVVEDTVRSLRFTPAGSAVSETWHAGYFDDEARFFAGTHDRHLADLLRAFRAAEPPPVPARCGLEALEVAHAAIRSHEDGRRVPLAEIRNA